MNEKWQIPLKPYTIARTWLLDQLQAGKTDSGLPQRFREWLIKEYGQDIDYTPCLAFFLACCREEHIYATIIDHRLTYAIHPLGVVPQPQQPWYEGIDKGKI